MVHALGFASGVSKPDLCGHEDVGVSGGRRLDHITMPWLYLEAGYLKARLELSWW